MRRQLTRKEKWQALLRVTSGSLAILCGYSFYTGDEKFYDNVVMPAVRLIDPEKAHNLAVIMTKFGIVSPRAEELPKLKTSVWGMEFSNPLGMAAGFDKHGEAIRGLHRIGFGFVEIGSVTPLPQDGNPKPRVFRLEEDKAVINRYGFNSDGHEVVYKRIKETKNGDFKGIIGVNLGKNKTAKDHTQDYVDGLIKFADVADYFVINVSSPNTPGLRSLQGKQHLEKLLTSVNEARKNLPHQPPLLLKVAPDLSSEERQDVADTVNTAKCRVDGLIISNTTIQRVDLKGTYRDETGGLSGAPLKALSTSMVKEMYERTDGKIPIIAAGGIFSGEDAYEKIKAGASLVEIYTSFTYHGPPIVNRIKRELNDLLSKDGYSSIVEAVGKNTRLSKA